MYECQALTHHPRLTPEVSLSSTAPIESVPNMTGNKQHAVISMPC